MKTRIIGYYSVFIGISVIALWIMILLNETLPEGRTELSFHLFSELVMALLCLSSGILMIRRVRAGKILNITGLGMVAYSVINAAGYYGERGDTAMMIMFIVIFLSTLAAVIMHFDKKES